MEIAFRLPTKIQWVALGEVRVQCRALHHRYGEQFGEGDQVVEPRDLAPGAVGDDQRRLAPRNQVGQLGDVILRRPYLRCSRDGPEFAWRRPLVHHRFNGNVHEGRPLGNPLRQLAGPHHLLIHGVGARGPAAPLGESVGEAVGAAHHAKAAVPLALGVEYPDSRRSSSLRPSTPASAPRRSSHHVPPCSPAAGRLQRAAALPASGR